MRPLNKEEYARLNQSLNNLSAILNKVGISEFSLTSEGRTVNWDNSNRKIDPALIAAFCDSIDDFHEKNIHFQGEN